jgi:hypothetical protein
MPMRATKSDLEGFFDHISKYMCRHLSYESDRLNAIKDVLNEFRSNKEPIFQIFGVPFKPTSRLFDLTINYTLFWRIENNQVHRRTDFPSWSWLGWQYNDEIPLQPTILCDLEDRAYSDGTYHLYGGRTQIDEHSAKISIEFLGAVY